MKPSRYNLFLELDNGLTLAYNARSGALAEIEKAKAPHIRRLMEHPTQADTPQDKELMESLIDGGYLVGDAIDEVAGLEVEANAWRISNATLSLTVAPTLACNFACEYCYENQSSAVMSEEIQQALLDFTERKLSESSKMLITWFGGEPTVCFLIIEKLQRDFVKIAEKHQAAMEPSSMITNGYLLDRKMAVRLKNLGITDIQITIDGPPEVHDRRRKLRDGRGTFDRIMDNLAATCDILDIGIRINVDRDNTDDACRVVEILRERGLLSKVKAYFAQVQSSGVTCADIRDRCFGQEEFAGFQVELYRKLIDKGILTVDYPQANGGVTCGAVSGNSYVVSPDGHLFRCWEELSLDQAKSVGDLFGTEPTAEQKANIERFDAWNPFALTACRECDILPVCMGGCPIHGIKAGHPDRGICSPWKYNLRDMLELRYRCEAAQEAIVE